MRNMNKIELINDETVILGPGNTWKDVLEVIPPTKYTMIHGQCTSVGVAGYILGGGINFVGTSNRYGSGADHVIQYTMVDAEGQILFVSCKYMSVFPKIDLSFMKIFLSGFKWECDSFRAQDWKRFIPI